MKINIFLASGSNSQERELLENFGAGIEVWANGLNSNKDIFENTVRIGRWDNLKNPWMHTVNYEYFEQWSPCDVAVIFGSWKPREKGSHTTRNTVVANAKKFIVIETPLLGRKTDVQNNYWRIGVNGYLNQDAYWPSLDSTVSLERLEKLGIRWDGWKNNPDGHILLGLQLPGDASLRGVNINEWAFQAIQTLRNHTNRTIVVRNHPLCSQRAFADHEELARKILLNNIGNIRFSDGQVVPWTDDIKNAYCTVTFSSGFGIDSVLAGIPTIACDRGNFAWDISSNHPDSVNSLKLVDSNKIAHWLNQLAGCQWSVEEMRAGEAWKHLLPVLERLE